MTVLEAVNLKRQATIKVGARPYAVALNRDDSRLFVTNQDDGTVAVVDTRERRLIKTITVGDKPEGISADQQAERIYVANWLDSTVSVIDSRLLEVVNTLKTGEGSRAFGEFISH